MANHEVVDEANISIAEFVLREEARQKQRAEKCGCGNCHADYEDALDRMDWHLEFGMWEREKPKVYIKHKVYQKDEGGDWREGEPPEGVEA